MLEPNISLGVQPVKIDSPVDSVSKLISLRSLMTENDLRKQQILQSQEQTKDIQAQAQQRERDLGDRQTFQKTLLDNKGDWDKTLNAVTGKIDPLNQETFRKSRDEAIKALQSRNQEQNKLDQENYAKFDNFLSGLKSIPDDDQRAVEYSNGLARFQSDPQLGPVIQQGMQSGLISKQYDPTSIDRVHAFVVGKKGLLDDAEKSQQTATSKASQTHTEQETINAQAQLPGITAESATKQSHLPVAQAIDAATLKSPGLLTPEQQVQQKNAEATQRNAAGHLWIAQQELALKKALQAAEIGPQSAQVWVDTLKQNPDAVDKIPEKLRNQVAEKFMQETGLPFPKSAAGTSQQIEISARNALDNANFIKKAIANPEIQKRLGPILGRLGEAEQNLGTTTAGLSPEAAKIAQELRTRLRYFVFQESKALLGGRLPQQLVEQLKAGSASVHMDEPNLRGALNGAIKTAETNLENVDRERFGGKARPGKDRGVPEQMEFRSSPQHPGLTFQRKEGSSDPWVQVTQ